MSKMLIAILVVTLLVGCNHLGLGSDQDSSDQLNWRIVDVTTQDYLESWQVSAPQVVQGKQLVEHGCKGRITPDTLESQVVTELDSQLEIQVDDLELIQARFAWVFDHYASGWMGRSISVKEGREYTFVVKKKVKKMLVTVTLADPNNKRHFLTFWADWGCLGVPQIQITNSRDI